VLTLQQQPASSEAEKFRHNMCGNYLQPSCHLQELHSPLKVAPHQETGSAEVVALQARSF
jgi:hypothetical protein